MSAALQEPGAFTPRPGAASLPRMLAAQTALEIRMVLRNGEQLLITVVIPLMVLVVFGNISFMSLHSHGARIDFLVPGVLALAVMSTSFSGLAIGTGFERRYGALKRLGASPLSRPALLGAKALSVLSIETLQITVLALVARLMGWSPHGSWAFAVLLLVLGTAAFASLALLMAGSLRAEATLAGANLVYLLLLVTGGIAVPLDRFPSGARPVLDALPSAALSEGLRTVLRDGHALPLWSVGVLAAWAAGAGLLAARTFRWE